MSYTPNLAEFLALLSTGHSQRDACLLARVSRRTVWLRRRSSPEFAAALHEAEQRSLAIRRERRDNRFRERFLALALEADDKKWLSSGRMSGKMKKLWQRRRGVWPEPQMPPADDPLGALVGAHVAEKRERDFAARRARKGKPPRREPELRPEAIIRPAPAPRPKTGPGSIPLDSEPAPGPQKRGIARVLF